MLKEKQPRKFTAAFLFIRVLLYELKILNTEFQPKRAQTSSPKRILFVCSRNRLRSPTAEQVFSDYENLEVSSAGLSPDAEEILTSEMVKWADVIFVMEKSHRAKLKRSFSSALRDKRVVCLDIPDEFDYMQPELIALLKAKVLPYLPAT